MTLLNTYVWREARFLCPTWEFLFFFPAAQVFFSFDNVFRRGSFGEAADRVDVLM